MLETRSSISNEKVLIAEYHAAVMNAVSPQTVIKGQFAIVRCWFWRTLRDWINALCAIYSSKTRAPLIMMPIDARDIMQPFHSPRDVLIARRGESFVNHSFVNPPRRCADTATVVGICSAEKWSLNGKRNSAENEFNSSANEPRELNFLSLVVINLFNIYNSSVLRLIHYCTANLK